MPNTLVVVVVVEYDSIGSPAIEPTTRGGEFHSLNSSMDVQVGVLDPY